MKTVIIKKSIVDNVHFGKAMEGQIKYLIMYLKVLNSQEKYKCKSSMKKKAINISEN